MHKSW
jgi:hypothetical protein